jgi:uroporphyrinogen-III synthase
VIFVKTGESNSNASYEARFGSFYEPVFVGVLRTKVDPVGLEALVRLLLLDRHGEHEHGSEGDEQETRFDGVVLTSARAVHSLQLAIRHIASSANIVPSVLHPDWRHKPFFVVGENTHNALAAMDPLNLFPPPDSLSILGHADAGSGAKLAQYIIAHFAREKSSDPSAHHSPGTDSSGDTIRLLYLTGNHQDSHLADTLSNHNHQQHQGPRTTELPILFELMSTQVYTSEPETDPQISPAAEWLMGRTDVSEDDDQDETMIREEMDRELSRLHEPDGDGEVKEGRGERKDWLVFFSPNTARILLENANDLLFKTMRRFHAFGTPLRLRHLRFAAIGNTTAAFLASRFRLNPLVPDSPSPDSLFLAISNFDYPHLEN